MTWYKAMQTDSGGKSKSATLKISAMSDAFTFVNGDKACMLFLGLVGILAAV